MLKPLQLPMYILQIFNESLVFVNLFIGTHSLLNQGKCLFIYTETVLGSVPLCNVNLTRMAVHCVKEKTVIFLLGTFFKLHTIFLFTCYFTLDKI